MLRNRRLGEFVPLFSYSGHPLAQGLASTFLTVSEQSITLDCNSAAVPLPGGVHLPPVDRAWLADAELTMVAVEQLGTFKRHVVVPEFRLPKLSETKR